MVLCLEIFEIFAAVWFIENRNLTRELLTKFQFNFSTTLHERIGETTTKYQTKHLIT